MVEFEIPDVDYTRYSNRQLIAIPLALLGLALVILIGNALITGTSPVSLGVAFTGGTEIRIQTADTQPQIERTFDAETESIAPIRAEQNEYIVTLPPSDTDPQSQAEAAGYEVVSSQERAASFGSDTQRQAFLGIGIAFVGMALLVFGLFRTFIPSIAVIASAFSDIVIPVALMSVLDISLTLGTVAALLMLIGYSVDSDLLLNNHILRRRGDFYESTYRAMQTGVTMTLTSITAMTAMTITASALGIDLLPSVGIILVFGLITDLMNTYMLNVSLLRYYKYEAVAR